MRVSPIGDYAATLEDALSLSKASAEVTHNHPEAIKGAQAVASAIFLARQGMDKAQLKAFIDEHFYPMDFTLSHVKDSRVPDATCAGSVPQALMCFFEGENFEDVIRNCIWLGGDCDTTAAMAGGIAEAYYGVDTWMVEEVKKRGYLEEIEELLD